MADPLTVLLSRVWIALVIETDSAVEAATPEAHRGRVRISYPMWANGLRLVDGSSKAELEQRSGARVNLPGLERWGWVRLGTRRRGDDGFGSGRGIGPGTTVRLTRAGTAATELWPRIVAEVEARWRSRFGDDVVDALRATPADAAAPWALPEVAQPDGFRTTVVDGDRTGGSRPLIAVLGGALTDLTVAAEQGATASLPIREDLLHALLDGPMPIRDLPLATGLAKEAVAMALTSARRDGFVEDGAARSIAMTDLGRAAAEVPDPEDDPHLRASLEAVLGRPDALREGLRPPTGTWRGERPYLARTTHLLGHLPEGLPRHPMVLHRAGWPDGS